MFKYTLGQITGKSDIQGAIALTGQYINVIFFIHCLLILYNLDPVVKPRGDNVLKNINSKFFDKTLSCHPVANQAPEKLSDFVGDADRGILVNTFSSLFISKNESGGDLYEIYTLFCFYNLM